MTILTEILMKINNMSNVNDKYKKKCGTLEICMKQSGTQQDSRSRTNILGDFQKDLKLTKKEYFFPFSLCLKCRKMFVHVSSLTIDVDVGYRQSC